MISFTIVATTFIALLGYTNAGNFTACSGPVGGMQECWTEIDGAGTDNITDSLCPSVPSVWREAIITPDSITYCCPGRILPRIPSSFDQLDETICCIGTPWVYEAAGSPANSCPLDSSTSSTSTSTTSSTDAAPTPAFQCTATLALTVSDYADQIASSFSSLATISTSTPGIDCSSSSLAAQSTLSTFSSTGEAVPMNTGIGNRPIALVGGLAAAAVFGF